MGKEPRKELKKKSTVAGITGGIASGKTAATDALKKAGFTVIDADEISRELFGRGTDGERALSTLFPCADNAGVLDRRALRRLISTDEGARKKLNSCTHPIITAEIKSRIKRSSGDIILSAPLLFESGLSSLCDTTVCVLAPKDIRIQRLMARDGVNKSDASYIIDAQIPDCVRASLADFCVTSNKPIDEYTAEIISLFERIFGKKI